MADSIDTAEEKLGDDLLWGGRAIGQELKIPPRKAYYLLETGVIPGEKIGGLWVGSKRKLRARFTGDAA